MANKYKPTVPVQGGLYPAGDFPLYYAEHVEMPDGTRLSTWQGGGGLEIPTIDLTDILDPLPEDGSEVTQIGVDLTEISAALAKGIVRVKVNLATGDTVTEYEVIMTAGTSTGGLLFWGTALEENKEIFIRFWPASDPSLGVVFGHTTKFQTENITAFNLSELGLPPVPMDGAAVTAEMDTAEIKAALDKGPVKFIVAFPIASGDVSVNVTAELIMNKAGVNAADGGLYICAYALVFNGAPMIFNLYVFDAYVAAYFTQLAKSEPLVTSIDMTAFDTAGQIVETYANGTVKTTIITFDESGNPVKIVDGDGNETTLTW